MEWQVCAEEGYDRPEEKRWSQADECSHAEEVVGDDESALGCKEEGIVERIDLPHVRYEQQRIAMGWNWGPRWQIQSEADMIKHEILQPDGILIVEPLSALAAEDFQALTTEVNEYLTGHPDLRGILIHARAFP